MVDSHHFNHQTHTLLFGQEREIHTEGERQRPKMGVMNSNQQEHIVVVPDNKNGGIKAKRKQSRDIKSSSEKLMKR